ncbi:MAG: GntR family transcriptional regulator [Rubrobacteraceae bacterium]
MAALWLKVDTKSGVPIYVQIVDQVQHAVEVGSLEAGDRLPTVRALAKELTVAPNTIVKAYNELQRAGLIESRPGVGTVVAEGIGDVAHERRVEALNERLTVLVRDAVGLGMTEDELWERFDAEFERMS